MFRVFSPTVYHLIANNLRFHLIYNMLDLQLICVPCRLVKVKTHKHVSNFLSHCTLRLSQPLQYSRNVTFTIVIYMDYTAVATSNMEQQGINNRKRKGCSYFWNFCKNAHYHSSLCHSVLYFPNQSEKWCTRALVHPRSIVD